MMTIQDNRPAYFVVVDARGSNDHVDYLVEGFTADGRSILKTWHIGEHSMRTECEAWRMRGAQERKL